MSVTLKQLGSKLSFEDVNEILKLYASETSPAGPFDGQIWLDISQSSAKPVLKRYNASLDAWHDVNPISGASSGLDADKVDSVHADSFIRSDADDSFSGVLTSIRSSGAAIKFDNGHSMITVHDGQGNLVLKSGVDENNIVSTVDGGSRIALYESGTIKLSITTQPVGAAFTDNVYLTIDNTGVYINGAKVWHAANDGAGSGLDADKLDGLEASAFALASHNHDASAITSGNIARARLSDLWYDRNLTTSQNPFIQTGHEYISALGPGQENIAFTYSFTDIPRIFTQVYGNSDVITFTRTYYITTTSTRISTYNISMYLTSGTVDWLAIGPC